MTFRQGLELGELQVFLGGLGEKKWMKEKGVVLSDKLKESSIYHIGLDEKVYVPLGEGDLVIEKAKDVLAKSGGKVEDVIKAIDQAAEMLGAVEDESSRDKVRRWSPFEIRAESEAPSQVPFSPGKETIPRDPPSSRKEIRNAPLSLDKASHPIR